MTKKPSLSELIDLISGQLARHDIRHALIGGIAVGLRGYPRATVDVDFLVADADREALREQLQGLGFTCAAETAETLHFTGLGPVDCLMARRDISLAMLNEATHVAGVQSPVLRSEDIIGLKIQAYCNDPTRLWQDKADIAALIRAHPDLDWARVMVYARLFEVEDDLQEMRRLLQA